MAKQASATRSRRWSPRRCGGFPRLRPVPGQGLRYPTLEVQGSYNQAITWGSFKRKLWGSLKLVWGLELIFLLNQRAVVQGSYNHAIAVAIYHF